jgi:hypothetical protein
LVNNTAVAQLPTKTEAQIPGNAEAYANRKLESNQRKRAIREQLKRLAKTTALGNKQLPQAFKRMSMANC